MSIFSNHLNNIFIRSELYYSGRGSSDLMTLYLRGLGVGVVKEESSFQARLFHNFKNNYFQKFLGEGSTLSIVL